MLLCSRVAVSGHAACIDRYCVPGWSQDRRLIARRKIGPNFALADCSIVQKLFRIDLPFIDSGPLFRQRCTTHRSNAQDPSK